MDKTIPGLDKLQNDYKDLVKKQAFETFVELHHREPQSYEVAGMEVELLENIRKVFEGKDASFQQAADTLSQKLPEQVSKEEWEEMRKEFAHASEVLSKSDKVISSLSGESEKTLQELTGMSEKTLAACFQVGKGLCREKQMAQALPVFDLLIFLNPLVADYWLASGLCHHQSGNFNEAVNAYSTASLLNPKLLLARSRAVEAYLSLEKLNEAKEELNLLEQQAKESSDEDWMGVVEYLSEQLASKGGL